LNLIVHADDFGNSRHMSEVIAECYQEGALMSASVMVTAEGFEASLPVLAAHPGMITSLHLNLSEGEPVSDPEVIPYLVNRVGVFHRGFAAIVRDYYLGSRRRKAAIREQIRHEYFAQITRYMERVQPDTLRIDSHQHYHAIPFIADILVAISDEVGIDYVRVPREPFFCECSSMQDVRNYLGANLLKHLLLNYLSAGLRARLDRHGIRNNDCFIGVLFTGNMTLGSIRKALKRCSGAGNIEVLLHPGRISPEEAKGRKEDPFRRFYTHPNRKREEAILKSKAFKQLLSSFIQ